MTKTFKGYNYNFAVSNSPISRRRSNFFITSMHRPTKRKSFITTVNVILSELRVNPDKPEFEDSDWVLDRKKADRLAVLAGRIFSDKEFLPYVEHCLDVDRKESEWENYE